MCGWICLVGGNRVYMKSILIVEDDENKRFQLYMIISVKHFLLLKLRQRTRCKVELKRFDKTFQA